MNSGPFFECSGCAKQYNRIDNLRQHVKRCVYGEITLFECEVCGSDFFSKAHMLKHNMEVHQNVKFECAYCGYSFDRKYTLRCHLECCQFKKKRTVSGYKCDVCNLKYKFKSSMIRHKRTVHVENELNSKANFKCDICKRSFTRKDVLLRHVGKTHMKNYSSSNLYQCDVCKKNFCLKERLKQHCTLHLTVYDSKCVKCYDFFPNTRSILQRMKKVPLTETNHEHLKFATIDDFYLWKKDMEKVTYTSYRKRAFTKSKKYTLLRFICHRSGTYVLKPNDRKRSKKLHGSKKVGTNCPAEICVRVLNEIGSCEAMYMKTHLGHDVQNKEEELHHIYISNKKEKLMYKRVNKQALSEIAKDIPQEDIVDDDADSIIFKSDVERGAKKLFDTQAADMTCFDAFIILHSDAVIYYKRQHEIDVKFPSLRTEDIVIIIMTDSQKQLLQKYGEVTVMVDGIHGFNKSGFLVHTLSVIDEEHEGIEVAFAVSNRSDETLISVFFDCIKETVGCIKTGALVTDIQEKYYTSWRKIMGEPGFRLFYSWHVREDWHRNLSYILIIEKRNALRNKLYRISSLLNENDFLIELSEFLEHDDLDLKPFLTYFNAFYVKNVTAWACCYRTDARINTNVKAESFYVELKKVIRKQNLCGNIPLNFCLEALHTFLLLKSMPLIQRAFKTKVPYKVVVLRKNHKLIENRKYTVEISGSSSEGWNISLFFDDKNEVDVHFICLSRESCQKCKLYCTKCDTCIHQYYCSCLDSTIRCNMCIHIHALCIFLRNSDLSTEPQSICAEIETPAYYLDTKLAEECCFESVEEIAEISEEPVDSSALAAIKEKLWGVINNLCDSLKDVEDVAMLLAAVCSWHTKHKPKNVINI